MTWRLIDTGPLDAAANMAVDEALLRSFDPAAPVPVLRLYGWEPPAFSLGRFQRGEEILDPDRCAAAGVAVVRRITGGGAIYHAEELTYSLVCAPSQIPGGAGVKESFRTLTRFLLDFYRGLGLAPSWAVDGPAAGPFGGRPPLCFAGREEFDVVVAGRKIGGNAQRRLKGVVFQHGSIPLRPVIARALPLLRRVPPELLSGSASLAELGVQRAGRELRERLAASFAAALGVELAASALTAAETALAADLVRERYGLAAWNRHGELS